MPCSPMTAIRSAITRFDHAAKEHAFKGSRHPEDRAGIEEEYAQARQVLEDRIEKAIENARKG